MRTNLEEGGEGKLETREGLIQSRHGANRGKHAPLNTLDSANITMTAPTILPYVALQHDFANVMADVRDGTVVSEDIYCSGYKAGSSSVHGKVNVYKDDGGDSRELQLESRDGVDVKFLGAHGLLPLSLD